MGVRASQIFGSIAGQLEQDGSLRVRRIYADVVMLTGTANTYNESASSNLSLTDAAHAIIEEQAVSSTLTLTQNAASVIFNSDQTVTDTLNVTDVAVGAREYTLAITQNLTLVSVGGQTFIQEIEDALGISDAVFEFNYVGDREPVGNILNLTQTVTTLSDISVQHTLNLIQEAIGKGALRESINQWMALSQHTSTPIRAFITDTLALVSTGYTPIYVIESITQNLALVQVIDPFGIIDTLNLTQSVLVGKGQVITQNLDITDEMEMTGLWIRTVNQDVGIGHALTWFEDTPCSKKRYTPFQGENTITGAPTPPRNTLQDPQGSTTDRLALYQPVTGVRTNEVVLRAPELDNRDRNSYTRVNTETRGGKLIVYSDPTWPKVRTLAITITGLTESQVDDLQTFLQSTVGQLIGLTDWEGNLWSGFITNPNEVATQDGKARWTVTLEMEGEKLEVEQPGNDDGNGMALNLSQSVTAVIT